LPPRELDDGGVEFLEEIVLVQDAPLQKQGRVAVFQAEPFEALPGMALRVQLGHLLHQPRGEPLMEPARDAPAQLVAQVMASSA